MKPQDKIIIDPFLQKILNERRNDANIRGIMESVQDRQNEIIYADFKTNIVVQGCAGSGKTVILFHRLANMEFSNTDFRVDEAVFISPNDEFKDFIASFTKSLDIRNLPMLTLSEYLENLGVDTDINRIVESNKAENRIALIETENQKLNLRLLHIKQSAQEDNLDSFLDKMNLSKRRDYLSFKRNEKNKAIVRSYDVSIKKMLEQDPEWNEINNRIQSNLAEATSLKEKVVVRKKYKYIFIDEGQDYSVDQYMLLRELNPNAVFNVFGDIKQKLSNFGLKNWSELEQVFQYDEFFLSENYRNSREIIEYVEKKLGNNFSMINMGPSLEEVREIDIDEVAQYYIYERDIMKSRDVAFIIDSDNNKDILKNKLSDFDKDIKNIFSIKTIKGMEFDAIFIFVDEKKLSDNELYVAYTRGRNMLYIVNNN